MQINLWNYTFITHQQGSRREQLKLYYYQNKAHQITVYILNQTSEPDISMLYSQ